MKHFNKNEEIFMENINSNEEIFKENRGRTKTNRKIKKLFVFMTPFIMGNALTLFAYSPHLGNPFILEKVKRPTTKVVSIDLSGKTETHDTWIYSKDETKFKYSYLTAVYQVNKDGNSYLITKTYSLPVIVMGDEVVTAAKNNDVSYIDSHFPYTIDVIPTNPMDIPNNKWILFGKLYNNTIIERMETPEENLNNLMIYIMLSMFITELSGLVLSIYSCYIETEEHKRGKTR